MRRHILTLVALIFLFSGVFALVYEVTWARMLSREFGSDAVAIAIVVSVFMLGLGLGARLAGVWGDRLHNPLRVYGILEIVLGAYVLASPWLIGGFMPLLALLGERGIENAWLLNSARITLGMVVLLPPTLIMGASLPLLARFAVDVAKHIPSAVISLYSINIVGAVVGVLAAGFWLLPVMGMTRVLTLVGLANVVLGLLVLVLSRSVTDTYRTRRPHPVTHTDMGDRWTTVKLVSAVALLGVASMACQLAWTRVIVLIVGGSAYAFSSVLAVFLAGLGIGAALAALALRWFSDRSVALFAIAGVLAAAAIFGSTFVLPSLPGYFLGLFDAEIAATQVGLLNLQTIIAAALFLAPVTFMGMMFPLALRIGLGSFDRPAADVGKLYLANSMGSVAGALLAGFILIPQIGILPTLLLAIGLICYAVLVVLSLRSGQLVQLAAAIVLLGGYGIGWYTVPPWNAQLMASGLSDHARAYQQMRLGLAEQLADWTDLLFYRDGLTSTVTVSRDRRLGISDLYIATNGKIDGSSRQDMPTQKLSAHLPLLLHPEPRRVAVVGMGTGVTAGSATLHDSVEEVVIIEIEPAMVAGARWFSAYNYGVHEHPKVDIRITDGRLHLFLAQERYDVIISEPSNPWIAGIASLFTEEYYRLSARALRPGGVFAQWLQLYQMEPDNVQSVVRSFAEVFPETYVAKTIVGTDMLLIGSQEPITFDVKALQDRLVPTVVEDLADPAVGVYSLAELLARIWITPDRLPELTHSARLHRDDWPFLMYEAPLSRYLETGRANAKMLSEVAGGLLLELLSDPDAHELVDDLGQSYQRFVPDELQWEFRSDKLR
jgi:spermidine synthase